MYTELFELEVEAIDQNVTIDGVSKTVHTWLCDPRYINYLNFKGKRIKAISVDFVFYEINWIPRPSYVPTMTDPNPLYSEPLSSDNNWGNVPPCCLLIFVGQNGLNIIPHKSPSGTATGDGEVMVVVNDSWYPDNAGIIRIAITSNFTA